MKLRTFDLERIQSLYENTVDYNLTESGFHPFTLKELLSEEQLNDITNTVLGYGQTNGSIPLRNRIAQLYKDCTADNVMVTNGSAEANFIACHTLLEKGDELVMMVPNYMQIWGVAEEMGLTPKAFHLRAENGWAPDLDELKKQMSNKTKMIAICNPNNPTGYTLTKEEIQEIVSIADYYGAWIYSDEIYRGAELNGIEITSFQGHYDKVMVNGGLSKAYALPGMRLGWLVGDEQTIANTWSYSDYTSITAGVLSHKIGEIALEPTKRSTILNRNRAMLNQNLNILQNWITAQGTLFELMPPKAGGMAFLKYNFDCNSTKLMEYLRKEKSVFIIAGDCFWMDNYIRIGIGAEKEYLEKGLDLVSEGIKKRFHQ